MAEGSNNKDPADTNGKGIRLIRPNNCAWRFPVISGVQYGNARWA